MKKKAMTDSQRKKMEKIKTRLRVKKHRDKKKEEGFKSLSIYISPKNIEILDRYKTLKYMDRYSYSHIFNELIESILKNRNKAFYERGYRSAKKNIKKDKYDF